MTLPEPVAKLLPYVKGIVALAALAATIVVAVVVAPPVWVYAVIAAASFLGVTGLPNTATTSQVQQIVKDLRVSYEAGRVVLKDVRTGDVHDVQTDGKALVTGINQTVFDTRPVITTVETDIKNVGSGGGGGAGQVTWNPSTTAPPTTLPTTLPTPPVSTDPTPPVKPVDPPAAV